MLPCRGPGWGAPWSALEQLLNTLRGNAKHFGRVTTAEMQTATSQGFDGTPRYGTGVLLFAVGSLPCRAVALHDIRNALRHLHLVFECYVAGVVDEHAQRFTDSPPGFLNRPPLRVASLDVDTEACHQPDSSRV
jgi:hypothetical protein